MPGKTKDGLKVYKTEDVDQVKKLIEKDLHSGTTHKRQADADVITKERQARKGRKPNEDYDSAEDDDPAERKELEKAGECGEGDFDAKPLDFKEIPPDALIFVIGKRRYGKTTWAEWVLYNLQVYFPEGGYVFTGTKHNEFWQQHFPDSRVYSGLDVAAFEGIFKEQMAKFEKFKTTGIIDTCPYVCVVFEDVLSFEHLRSDPALARMVFNGRHFFLFIMLLIQDVKGVLPSQRQNADIIALTYQTQKRAFESVQEDWAAMWEEKNGFVSFLMNNTQDHKMVIIDQTQAKYKKEEIFAVDKAPNPDEISLEYKIGSDLFWKISRADWKKQLEKCATSRKVQRTKKEEWANLGRKQMKIEAIKVQHGQEAREEDNRAVTGLWAFAPPEIIERERSKHRQSHPGTKEKVQAMITGAYRWVQPEFNYWSDE
jgi:hypothetical protein